MDAANLRESLKALGLSQSELARKLGYTPDAVSRWCMGHVPVPKHVAEHLRILLLAKEMLK